mgnify:CR=1 FL=1
MTTAQVWFWLAVLATTAILPAVAGVAINFVRKHVFTVVCDQLGNNNARAAAGLLLALLLTISAFIGGRGEPLLQERWDKAKESAKTVEAPQGAKNFFWQAFTGDGEVQIGIEPDPPQAVPDKEDEDKPTGPRPSWWNWIVALVAWPLAFGYFLWSFHDEVARAISRVWQRRRATLHAENNPTAPAEGGTAPASAPQASGNRSNGNNRRGWSFSLDLLTDIIAEVFGEIFAKLMSRGVVG